MFIEQMPQDSSFGGWGTCADSTFWRRVHQPSQYEAVAPHVAAAAPVNGHRGGAARGARGSAGLRAGAAVPRRRLEPPARPLPCLGDRSGKCREKCVFTQKMALQWAVLLGQASTMCSSRERIEVGLGNWLIKSNWFWLKADGSSSNPSV